MDDAYDTDNDGTTLSPVDTDSDDTPDYLDTDSDDDSTLDVEEKGNNTINAPSDLSNINSSTDVDFRDPDVQTLSADSFDIEAYKNAFSIVYDTTTKKPKLCLKNDAIGQLTITVSSLSGQTIAKQTDTKNTELWEYPLEIATPSAGVYIVELNTAKNHWTKKILLK